MEKTKFMKVVEGLKEKHLGSLEEPYHVDVHASAEFYHPSEFATVEDTEKAAKIHDGVYCGDITETVKKRKILWDKKVDLAEFKFDEHDSLFEAIVYDSKMEEPIKAMARGFEEQIEGSRSEVVDKSGKLIYGRFSEE